MAHDQDTDLSIHGLQLLQRGYDKHGGFAHATLGLADHIHTQDGLRNTLVLNCGREGEMVSTMITAVAGYTELGLLGWTGAE